MTCMLKICKAYNIYTKNVHTLFVCPTNPIFHILTSWVFSSNPKTKYIQRIPVSIPFNEFVLGYTTELQQPLYSGTLDERPPWVSKTAPYKGVVFGKGIIGFCIWYIFDFLNQIFFFWWEIRTAHPSPPLKELRKANCDRAMLLSLFWVARRW